MEPAKLATPHACVDGKTGDWVKEMCRKRAQNFIDLFRSKDDDLFLFRPRWLMDSPDITGDRTVLRIRKREAEKSVSVDYRPPCQGSVTRQQQTMPLLHLFRTELL